MGITTKTLKMLWGRSASLCAFPGCTREELIEESTSLDSASIVGDNAHIRSEKPDGPRFDPNFPIETIDNYENLILLCKVHHKIIDDQVSTYTVEALEKMKQDHVLRVRNVLNLTTVEKIRDDETYVDYLEILSKLADFEDWNNWIASIFANDIPRMTIEREENLGNLREILFNRIWPNRYPELEKAFINFRLVLSDFHEQFRSRAIKSGNLSVTEKFYQINEWNEEKYHDLLEQYRFHVFLVEDLALELTRAANYLLENIRKYLLPKYREREGYFTVTAGPFIDFTHRTSIPKYSIEEKEKNHPYPGLNNFLTERKNRDESYDFRKSYKDSQLPLP
ncbi:HNH endonuclease [Leptospira sp. WS39.C2]